jgi:hypothetical protein
MIKHVKRLMPELDQWVTPWRLKWYPRVVLIALSVGTIFGVLYGKGLNTLTGRLGADYPAFYGAGRIIAQGEWNQLYNAKRQMLAQENFIPGEPGYLCFAYPPYVALLYWPFSLLEYRLSYTLHTLLMVGALLLTLHLVRPMIKEVDQHYLCAFTLTLLFYPIFRSVLGGQNTAITLLIVALTWRAVENGHEYLGGALLGLLLFKPQFALPLIGVFVLSGRCRVGLGSVFTAVILYGIGVWMQGPNWVTTWFKFGQWFSHADASVNSNNAISWLGFFQAFFDVGSKTALILGWGMTLGTIVGLSWIWWAGGPEADLTSQIGLASVCLVLIPPHTMYYDMGLLFFTYAALIVKKEKGRILLIGTVWLLGFSQMVSGLIGFSPLFFLVVFTWILGIRFLALATLKPQLIK